MIADHVNTINTTSMALLVGMLDLLFYSVFVSTASQQMQMTPGCSIHS